MSEYKIHPMVIGTKMFDKGMMTYQHNYGTAYTIPIYSWYIEGHDKKILVDTGEMSPIRSEDRENAIGGKIYTFEEGLGRWGLKPEDIDIVIHTHLHNDHCENDYKCVNATFYVHKNELERIHAPHPLDFRYFEDFIFRFLPIINSISRSASCRTTKSFPNIIDCNRCKANTRNIHYTRINNSICDAS